MLSPKTGLAALLAGSLVLANSASAQTVLIDFGNATSYRGLSVANPDSKGHYWNSLQPGLFYSNLVDTNNTATTIDLGFSTAVGTDSYNGPAGATDAPPTSGQIAATDFDAAALGDLGITNAVIDFAAGSGGVCKFEIQQLNPAKRYNLKFFGSHKFNADANTIYTVYADSGYTQILGQTNVNVYAPGTPWLHNRDKVVTISDLAATSVNNILYVSFVGSGGGDGYLNALEITEAPVTSASIITFDNFSSDALYPNWSAPGVTAGTTNYIVTATGYGANYKYIGYPPIYAAGQTTIQLTCTLSGSAGADGQLGPIVELIDNDGTDVKYAWYGQTLGHHVLTMPVGTPTTTVAAGTTPGLDLGNLVHSHISLDPGGYSGAYTISWEDLSAITPSTGAPITITSQSYNQNTHVLSLTWTSEAGATYTIEGTSSLGTGFGTLQSGIASGGATTTYGVTVNSNAEFVRIKK